MTEDAAATATATATALIAEARSLDAEGNHQPALDCVLRAISIFRQSASAAEQDTAKALCTAAKIASSLGRDDVAVEYRREAVSIFRKIHGDRGHSLLASAMMKLAKLLKRLGREPELARQLDRDGRAMLWRLEPASQAELQALCDQCNVFQRAGKFLDLLRVSKRMLDLNRQVLAADADDDYNTATAIQNVAYAHTELGHDAEGLAAQIEALGAYRRYFDGADHEELANSIMDLGFRYGSLDRYEDALKLNTEALEMHRRLAKGTDSGAVAKTMEAVAEALFHLHHHEEALPMYEGALAMLRRLTGGGDHEIVARVTNRVATTLFVLKRHAEASPLHEAALAMQRRLTRRRDAASLSPHAHLARDNDDEVLANWIYSLAVVKSTQGDFDRAEQLCTEAFQILMRLYPDGHETAGAVLFTSGVNLLRNEATRDEGVNKLDQGMAMYRRVAADSSSLALRIREAGRLLVDCGRREKGNVLIAESTAMEKRLATAEAG